MFENGNGWKQKWLKVIGNGNENDWKWLEIPGNGLKWQEMVEIIGNVRNG